MRAVCYTERRDAQIDLSTSEAWGSSATADWMRGRALTRKTSVPSTLPIVTYTGLLLNIKERQHFDKQNKYTTHIKGVEESTFLEES